MSLLSLSKRLNPITYRRLQRFKELKRAYYSLWLLIALYLLSLGAELICNDRPLYVRYDHGSYFPVFFFYPENTFNQSGRLTRPDYKALNQTPVFAEDEDNFMIFPVIPFGPTEIIKQSSITASNEVKITVKREARVATVNVDQNYRIRRSQRAGWFFGLKDAEPENLALNDYYTLPEKLKRAIADRFENNKADAFTETSHGRGRDVLVRLSPYQPRSRPPGTVRLSLVEIVAGDFSGVWRYNTRTPVAGWNDALWNRLAADQQQKILDTARHRIQGADKTLRLENDGAVYRLDFKKENVTFPFRPVAGHPLGIDSAGRDVLARLLYGLRTSLNFGLLLSFAAMIVGTLIGAVQGYYGGKVDLIGQRLTEIWEALPFLYVLILLGSVYGQNFLLLLFVYGIFNWIGISYYMRAEFLRLRTLPFVEAAHCLGIPDRKIVLKHILPNGLVPLITFFPFSLVGAIGTLAALDYLGFGLPPPTPSWGELLSQAQEQPRWWLILYPSLALFTVMILGVFVGEGIRSAFDPRKFTRME